MLRRIIIREYPSSKLSTKPFIHEWCCIIDGGYTTRCLSCHFPSEFVSRFSKRQSGQPKADKYSAEDFYYSFSSFHAKQNKNKIKDVLKNDVYEHFNRLGVFELSDMNIEQVKLQFKKLAIIKHPDRDSGSTKEFQELQEAYEQVLKYLHNI